MASAAINGLGGFPADLQGVVDEREGATLVVKNFLES